MADQVLEGQLDQLLALIPMALEMAPLVQVAATLELDVAAEVAAENRRAVYRKIANLLNSVGFDTADERPHKIQTCLATMTDHLGLVNVEQKVGVGAPKLEQSESESEEEEDVVKKETDASKVSTLLSGMRLKEFKFDGQIGYPGEKGKLDFTGVMHNINMAKKRKFPPEEICYAAIRAIVPGHPTRTYLEGEEDLSVDKVVAAFRSHFLQKDVTDIYNEMTHAAQGTGERDTAYTFVASMFGVRNVINNLCKNKHVGGTKYTPAFIQSEMQKSIYNGLRDEEVRQDLKQLLGKDGLSDGELLAALTEAMASKRAHDERLKQLEAKSRSQKVSNNVVSVTTSDDEDAQDGGGSSKSRSRRRKGKSSKSSGSVSSPQGNDIFMAQLASVIGSEIRGAVEPLQAQINDLNQRQFQSSFPLPVQNQQKNNQNPNNLNPRAQSFPKNGASNAAMGRPGQNVGNTHANGPAATPAPTPAFDGAGPCSDEFLGRIFRQVFGNGMGNLNAAKGTSSGGNQSQYNGVFLNSKCSNCRNAGAVFCNHCQICHKVDHRNINCPKRADPNWKPLN